MCLLFLPRNRELQRVLKQGTAALKQPGAKAFESNKPGWGEKALEAAEAVYLEQLQREALEGVASIEGAVCRVTVPFDFWLHVLEKHEGPGLSEGREQ
jgi:hypothetical protein